MQVSEVPLPCLFLLLYAECDGGLGLLLVLFVQHVLDSLLQVLGVAGPHHSLPLLYILKLVIDEKVGQAHLLLSEILPHSLQGQVVQEVWAILHLPRHHHSHLHPSGVSLLP